MIRTIMAGQLHAGDSLVVVEGSVRRYYHIDEVYKNPKIVKVSYKNKAGRYMRETHKPRHRVRIRA